MARIYESIKDAVTSKMISSAASVLGEDENKVASATKYLIASQLASLINVTPDQRITDVVKLAGKMNIFRKKEQLFEGSGLIDGVNVGERFENALVGSRNREFPRIIASESGIKPANADRLSNWTSGLIAGYLGDKVVKEKRSLASLIKELDDEKDTILKDVPAGIAEELKLTACDVGSSTNHPACAPKKKNRWLWWLLGIILLILVVILIMRSCDGRRDNVRANNERITNVSNNSSRNSTNNSSNNSTRAAATTTPAGNNMVTITLGDGTEMTVRKGGCEDRMVSYLNSDKYRNASADDLRNDWIEFDNIDFQFNSATEMLPGSERQLHNIAAILKHYPDAKIRIGGYADEKGTRAVNMDISEERAEHVKSLFVADGINANRVSTKGFGKEFATVPADASDAARAVDRTIAFRFDK